MSSLKKEVARHEAVVKRRTLLIHRLYLKARDREKAGRLLDDFTLGKITYKDLIRELKRLARS